MFAEVVAADYMLYWIIGAVSVVFPLFTRFELYKTEESEEAGDSFLIPTRNQCLAAEFINLLLLF